MSHHHSTLLLWPTGSFRETSKAVHKFCMLNHVGFEGFPFPLCSLTAQINRILMAKGYFFLQELKEIRDLKITIGFPEE